MGNTYDPQGTHVFRSEHAVQPVPPVWQRTRPTGSHVEGHARGPAGGARDLGGRRDPGPARLGQRAGEHARLVFRRVDRQRDLVPRARPVDRRCGLAISVTPILLLLLFVVITRRGARRLLATERAEVRASEWSGVVVRHIVPGFILGYAAVSALVALLTLGGPAGPGAAAVLGALVVPVAALGALLLRPGEAGTWDPWEPARLVLDRAPDWLGRAWRCGWRGVWLLLGVGLALVLLRLLLAMGTVLRVHGEYDLNVVAGLVLVLAQVAFLGNLATWGLSFLAGPGFSVAVGGAISPAAAHPGLMPLVPVLGGLPDEATYSWPMWLVVVLPVLGGAAIGRWVDREGGGSGLRDRCLGAGGACVIAVAVVGTLTALGNGSVGAERLSAVGPGVLPLMGALLVETLVGAAAFIGWRAWSERRA